MLEAKDASPEFKISVGQDAITKEIVQADAETFIRRADESRPGTQVFIGNTALGNPEDLVIGPETTTLTLPNDAINRQCEHPFVRGDW